jgi:hypothetical protein
MPEFANPFAGNKADRRLTKEEFIRAMRYRVAGRTVRKVGRVAQDGHRWAGIVSHPGRRLAPGTFLRRNPT